MSGRKPLISGNWKMYLNHLEAIQTIQKLSYVLDKADYAAVDVSVHPPFTCLRSVQTVLLGDDIPIRLGAQNCHWESEGAYTGEVSPTMLAKLDVGYVIVGHSERRQLFGDTDENVNRKLRAVLAAGMTPVLCVGETLEEREAGATIERVEGQLDAGLEGVTAAQVGGAGGGLRAHLGHRDRAHGHGGGRPVRVRRHPGEGGGARRGGGGDRRAHPVRRLGQARERRRAAGPARHRRCPGRRRLPGARRLRRHHPGRAPADRSGTERGPCYRPGAC